MKSLVIAICIVLAISGESFAGIIAESDSLNVLVVQVLGPVEGHPGAAEAFNFFFSIEVLFGVVTLAVRLIIRAFRM